jgi:uncharacterized protein (TIGR02145 family)
MKIMTKFKFSLGYLIFTFVFPIVSESQVTDIDNNAYKTVKIGKQIWMSENLKTTKYRNGDKIRTTSSPTLNIKREASEAKYQWAYKGDEKNVSKYGRLYTWYAITDSRDICPTGWNFPIEEDWQTLTDFLTSETVAGGKMKEKGLEHWNDPNEGATNESGFLALPAGYRSNDGSFDGLGMAGYWWSATENFDANGWSRVVNWISSNLSKNSENKSYGFSVRCMKNL